MKKTLMSVLLVSSCLAQTQVHAVDALSWILSTIGDRSILAVDSLDSGPAIGPLYSPNEGELAKQLIGRTIVGTPEQIKMLTEGPTYITGNGLKPVGNNRLYRMKKDGFSTDFFITFTDNMSEKYKQYVAQNAIKYNGVLVLRGLLNDSVEDTIQSMKPYVDMGALVMIDPNVEARFGKNFVAKAPIFVHALVNEATNKYECKSDTEKKCFAFTSVSGVARKIFDGLNFDLTIDHLSLGPIMSQWNTSNKGYQSLFEERFKSKK